MDIETRFKLDFVDNYGLDPTELPDFISIFDSGIGVIKRNNDVQKSDLKGGVVVNLVLVDDESIQRINKKYRKKDVTTDVVSLSYLAGDKFPGEDLVGEIFISVDTAKRQAIEHNHPLKEELLYLFAHGLLHVFGYDHKEETERVRMFSLQEEILAD